jgi:hypothetical protein
MYVARLASRSAALDFLHYLETGQHLGLPAVRLEKAAALIVEPLSPGARAGACMRINSDRMRIASEQAAALVVEPLSPGARAGACMHVFPAAASRPWQARGHSMQWSSFHARRACMRASSACMRISSEWHACL